ncbi:lytic murein transglycosylase [Plantactinospora sp. CA-294935]|uniref:lytic transglycosylase domain-containing protein n=1 Tax=Plantactinospora sp. CA-294935 TaxID=3240012 RepID=UPI003D91896A
MAEPDEISTTRPLRPAAPVFDGPLASSGAAPDPDFDPPSVTVPRPRAGAEPVRPTEPEPVATPAEPKATGAESASPTASEPDPASPTASEPESASPTASEPDPAADRATGEPELDSVTETAPVPVAGSGSDPGVGSEPGPLTGSRADSTLTSEGEAATEPGPTTERPESAAGTEPTTAAGPTAGAGTEDAAGPTAQPTAPGGAESAAGPAGGSAGTSAPTATPPTTGKPGETVIDLDVPATAPAGPNRRIRVRFAHAVARWPSPGAVRAWSKRPSGRVTLPALLLFALVAATGAAGAFLLPATARQAGPVQPGAATSPPPSPTAPGFPVGPAGLPSGLPSPPAFGTPSVPAPPWNATGGRPSDVLAGWAAQIGPRVGISTTAMQAYGYAELQVGQTAPGCQLRWTTLAAIGQVESAHGRANGAILGANGIAAPEIIGLALDGNGGRMRILDTEDGRLDRDATYDRAVGPMQFIPTTWEEIGADADGDGVENPHSIDDAALAAGNYLCKGGRNLSVASDWWSAILSYNDVRPYAQSVFNAANKYGTDSRT